MSDVLAAFIIFQAAFFFLDIYIYFKTNRDIARKGEYTFFGILILVHMCYLVLNSTWSLQEYGVFHLSFIGMNHIVVGSLSAVTGCAYAFYLFTIEKIRFMPMMKKPARLVCSLPAIVSFGFILSSPWTGWIYYLDRTNRLVHGPLYAVMLVSTSLYLLFVIFIAGYNLVTARTAVRRHSSAALLLSVLLIVVFVVLDDLIYKASVLPVAVFAVILVIFINMQESNINSDALTGMNNRRKAMDFLTDRLGSVSLENPMLLYIGDLDKFKSINDVYGHAVGDEALILCGNVLKHVIARYDGFAARYGGDEFLMSWQPLKGVEADPEELITQINESLEKESEGKPYLLHMSVGYTRCTDRNETLTTYIRQADAMLYQRKRR